MRIAVVMPTVTRSAKAKKVGIISDSGEKYRRWKSIRQRIMTAREELSTDAARCSLSVRVHSRGYNISL